MTNRPQPRPGVLDIAPYIPGKRSAPGVAKIFKLSSNETPMGASESTIAAYRAVGEHLEDYPDGSASALREAIGDVFGLDPARIVCGAGSAQALSLLEDFIAVPDRAFDGAALLVTLPQGVSLETVSAALVKAGATMRSSALVGSHATRYRVPAKPESRHEPQPIAP